MTNSPNIQYRPQWKVRRQRPPNDKCRCSFPAWVERQNMRRADKENVLKIWERLPRRDGRIIFPDFILPKHDVPPILPTPPDIDQWSEAVYNAFLLWIELLKKEEYVV